MKYSIIFYRNTLCHKCHKFKCQYQMIMNIKKFLTFLGKDRKIYLEKSVVIKFVRTTYESFCWNFTICFLLYFPKDHVQKHAMTRNHVEGDVHIDTSMTRMAAIPANVIIDYNHTFMSSNIGLINQRQMSCQCWCRSLFLLSTGSVSRKLIFLEKFILSSMNTKTLNKNTQKCWKYIR